jgi:hypothetical protein
MFCFGCGYPITSVIIFCGLTFVETLALYRGLTTGNQFFKGLIFLFYTTWTLLGLFYVVSITDTGALLGVHSLWVLFSGICTFILALIMRLKKIHTV